MKFNIQIGKTANTTCHKCGAVLKGKKYLRIDEMGRNVYKGDIVVSICESCLDAISTALKDSTVTEKNW